MSLGITVFIPTFNSSRWIRELLISIKASIDNARVPHEVLILDDCSTDGTPGIIAKIAEELKIDYKIFCHDQLNSSGSSSVSYAMGLSLFTPKYDLIVFSDHDDVWLINKAIRIIDSYKLSDNSIPWLYAGTSLVWNQEKASGLKLRSAPGPNGNNYIVGSQLDRRKTQFEVAVSTHNIAINKTAWGLLAKEKITERVVKSDIYFDNWVPFVISKLGHTSVDLNPTLLWREHHENASGLFSNRRSFNNILTRVRRYVSLLGNNEVIVKYIIADSYLKDLIALPSFQPKNNLPNGWSIEEFSSFKKRLVLASSKEWMHWNSFVNILIRIRIITLNRKSVGRIRVRYDGLKMTPNNNATY